MLYNLFLQTLKKHANEIALVHDTQRLSYQDLYQRIVACSEGLRALDVQVTSRVALVLPNCPEFVISYYAVARLNAIFVPLSPLLKEDELTFYLRDCAPRVIITDRKRAVICQRIISALSDIPASKQIQLVVIDDSSSHSLSFSSLYLDTTITNDENNIFVAGDDDIVYHYSSGTTGRPKRVPRTQKNLFYDTANMAKLLSITSSDNFLCTIPLFHSYGQLLFVLMPIFAGATLVLLEQPVQDGLAVEVPFAARCARVLELIEQEHVTLLPAVPYVFSALAETSLDVEADISSLRACYSAGSFLPRETFDRFLARFGIPVRQTYGTTEGGLIAANIDPAAEVTYDTVGIIPSTIEVRILDENFITQPAGVIGEVVIKSPTLTAGYTDLPELNKEAFRDGCYFTGDLGKKDEKGYLYLTGRKKLLIDIAGGYKVDPIEVEDMLLSYPQIAEAAVVGLGSLQEGLILTAFVLAREACTEDELLAYCRERLADFKVPQHVEFCTSFPKSSLGKILREELVREYEMRTARTSAVDETATFVASVLVAPEHERLAMFVAYVRKVVAQTFRLALADIDEDQHLSLIGLDSLMAVQLRHRLETDLRMSVSLVKLLQGLTVTQIAQLLLEQLLTNGLPAVVAMEHANASVYEYPLSYGQSALWYIYQSDPESAAHNTFVAMRVLSGLDIQALRRSLQYLVDRHASLRTIYTLSDDRPVQRILPHMPVNFQLIDVANLSADDVHTIINETSQRPFELEREGTLRAHLFISPEQQPILLLNAHHIATDFWSMVVLMDELRQYYQAEVSGKAHELATQVFQYSDYQQWEAKLLESPIGQQAQNYWLQQLAGDLPTLNLPTDRLRPPLKTMRGARYFFSVDEELTAQIRQIARSERVTLYTLLLTAFQVLLSRYSGQEEFFMGSPTMIRDRVELQNMVGYLVNPVVLRANVSADVTFTSLLRQVSGTVLNALEHQDFSFMSLVKHLLADRDLSRSPVFDVMFVLDRPQRVEMQRLPEIAVGKPGVQMDLGGLLVETYPLQQQSAQFDLSLIIIETDTSCSTSWEYNSDLFDEATIARLVASFQHLLKSIIANPDQQVSRLQLLSSAERQQLLATWNETQSPASDTCYIHQMFAAQARRRPDAVAIVSQETHITYAELDLRTTQLASYLQASGVGPETLVGVCMERSVANVIGMLGILKAGGAYVPLDPSYPEERLRYMLEDAGITLLLTQQKLSAQLPAYQGETLYLDSEWARISQQQTVLQDQLLPENLAYVIYTSGSMGRPKGVQISHAGLCNLVNWHCQTYQVTPADRATQIAGTSFDASVWELWPYIAAGASLYIPDEETRLLPTRLKTWLGEQSITLTFLPTPLAESILNDAADWPEHLALRALLTGGDYLHVRPSAQIPFALINHYGPTEGSVVATAGAVQQATEDARTPSIGRPIDNVQIYVLDKQYQLVPIGVAGELFIGGSGLARGYLGRPDLTVESFIAHPYSQEAGARLYRTGDLVKYLPDGNIEYLGRIDHQVKLRGYRIELGEIDMVINQYAGIQEVVTEAREDVPGEKRLVSYLVAKELDLVDAATVADEQAQYIATWQELYDRTYLQSTEKDEGTFNIVGWNSSYTGEPIAAEEMQVQVEQTAERILALKPRRILEIGCGTGLLLFRVAPVCQRYVATDYSSAVLEWVGQQDQMKVLPQVQLLERVAHDLHGLESERFDVVIINSTIQYFPGIEYLVGVLEQVVSMVEPGGKIFIGDVRSFRHLETYHGSVQFFRASDSLSTKQLLQRIDKYVRREEELLIEPTFFQALKEHIAQVGDVQMQLRRGVAHNEITRFRYDALLHIGVEKKPEAETSWIWQDNELDTIEQIRQRLSIESPAVARLSRVPNAHLWHDVQALRLLASDDLAGPETVGDVREILDNQADKGIDPELWWSLGEETGYLVEVSWSDADIEYCDVLFRKELRIYSIKSSATTLATHWRDVVKSWRIYANNPLQGKLAHKLIPQLRTFLEKRLPEYMIPAAFVLMDALPLTQNGKIDRRKLPAPDQTSFDHASIFVAPRTPIEQMLTELVAELLGMEQVGIHDNFFELGGHSLLVMQLISRVRSVFQVELPFTLFFEAPTVAGLAENVERENSQEQQVSLVSVPRGETLPLSFAQERLWFLDQLTPENPFYNLPVVIRLQGSLDIETFGRSLEAIVQRHESLRATFKTTDGRPYQIVSDQINLSLPLVDLRMLSIEAREIEVQRLATLEMQQSFNLAQGPLLRAMLLRVSKEEHVLLLIIHHIVSDGWSVGVLIRDLATFYEAFTHGNLSPLPALAVQYVDFAVWQRQWLQGEIYETQLAYWKRQLSGMPMLQLPTDRPRPAVQTFKGAHYPLQFSRSLTRGLKAISQQEKVTLFMTLLASFQLLLARYTGLDDIAIGVGIANRNRREIEEMIGFFVNTLVLRTDFSHNPSFRELLDRVRSVTLEAYAHQDLPLEKLVAELHPERNLSQQPLFQVLFIFQNFPMPDMELSEVSISPITIESTTSKFDLTLSLDDMGQGLSGWLEYSTDLFDTSTIKRMVGHWQRLLDEVVAHIELPISVLPMLTDAEQKLLTVHYNDTAKSYPHGLTIPQLLEKQVLKTPDAIALVVEQEQVSYAELDRRAKQLACYLQQRGVGPDVPVGVCVSRSPEMLVAILGVLKAGGTYVPLDPAYPSERLVYQLTDAQVHLLLTQEALLDTLAGLPVSYLYLDRDWSRIAQQEESTPEYVVLPEHLAYVIYTSGSTGRPKGVAIAHASTVNLLYWAQEIFSPVMTQRVLASTSICFDLSIFELFVPLSQGGTVVLVENVLALSTQTADQGITLINTVPSVIGELLRAGQIPASVQTINLAGEALGHGLVAQLYQQTGVERIYNLYGPSEDTTYSTAALLLRDEHDVVPIGRPRANTRAYVLDRQWQLVPQGVIGELYLAGAGLARGYLGLADLTAARFVPDLFSEQAGGRLYRTGDLVRYLPDGQLEYVGRVDQQVKVRGFRIELGEIESVLEQQEQVREAVVLAREDTPGSKRLVAYLVPTEQHLFSWSDVRASLQAQLPDYMVPALHIVMTRFPLTPNGKIDRRALPAPDYTHMTDIQSYEVPRNQRELQLVEIWQQVLGIEQLGIHDNFFALGGDSILSIQIVARANHAGMHMTPKHMFAYQTIAELTQGLANEAERSVVVSAEQGLVKGHVPLTPIQHWFFVQEQAELQHWNQGILLNTLPHLEAEYLRAALAQVLMHHDALRLRFTHTSDGWQQVNASEEAQVPFLQINLSTMPIVQQQQAIEIQTAEQQASLNLATGPLLRMVYFDLGDAHEGRLLIIIHHLAVDGVSWRILIEDLQQAYLQLSQGKEIKLPAKTSSWQQWAQRLQEYARSTEIAQELDYWQQQIQTPPVSLPEDLHEGENTIASMRNVEILLSQQETQDLLQKVPAAYHTQINDILLTALAQTLQQWVGGNEYLIALEGHGREDLFAELNLSRTVGWFTGLFPLKLTLGEQSDPGTILKAIKEQVRALPQHGIGYGVLRYLCHNDEQTDALVQQPQPQISFNYLGQFGQLASSKFDIFSRLREASGPLRSPQGHREYLLEINGIVNEGQLQISWFYSTHRHQEETIVALAQTYLRALRALIAHCLSPEVGGYTPSDFPLARMSQQQLDVVVSQHRDIEAIYPLSPLQQGLLFQSLYAPSEGDYITQAQLTLRGPLDSEAFASVWRQVTQRHAILRTAFIWEDVEEPLQVVWKQVDLPYEVWDWRGYSSQEQEERLEAYRNAHRLQAFRLSEAPLMRITLIQMAENHHELIWTHHHLLLDGWSLAIVLKEIFAGYEALNEDRTIEWKPVQSYQRHIAWVQQQSLDSAETFWRHLLAGFTVPTSLSIDRLPAPEAAPQQKRYDELRRYLSPETTSALQTFVRQHHLTLNTVLSGAWALLLAYYSAHDDIVFGMTVSGRPTDIVGIEEMVGLFINTLPMRVQLDGQSSLLAWLRDWQVQQSEMRQYEYSPLVQVQNWSQIERGTALFESLFVFENYPLVRPESESDSNKLQVTATQAFGQTHYPLTMTFLPDERLGWRLTYDLTRFQRTDMKRLLVHLQVIMEQLLTNPEQVIGTINLLTASEQEQLLSTWNQTRTEYPREATIASLFEEQVVRSPEAIALVCGSEQMSYAELNRRANQLAHQLHDLGVGPDVLVGVCMERSIELLIAILSILKAGGAYLPLDVSYPQARLEMMLTDGQSPVLLTQRALRSQLPAGIARVFCLDEEDSFPWRQASEENLMVPVAAEHLAYVMYTSGSTGRPKGVSVTQRSVVRLVKENPFASLQPEDVFLQLAPVSFDASTLEIWGSLLNGARLVLYPDQVPALEELAELLREQSISVLWLTAGLFHQMVEHQLEAVVGVRQVLAGGDVLAVPQVKNVLSQGKEISLINGYGPTENTTFTTSYTMSKVEQVGQTVPIGRPIGNTQIYVVDAWQRPVPVGVVGELYTGGDGLARGYLGEAALTAERFVPDLWSVELGARVYRTGDLVRYRSDGALEYVGRVDQQVKVRGYRIELGEIESVLEQQELVRSAIVLAREDTPGNKRLVAYIIPTNNVSFSWEAVRADLQGKLPDYMVPALHLVLDSFPLTSNGKIDRHALPVPDYAHLSDAQTYEPAHNEIEQQLVEIWQQVLGVEQIGVYDNFFTLGGDSILSIQIIARARQAGLQVTPKQIFEHKTISQLANVVKVERTPLAEQSLVIGEVPLTPIQHWFFGHQSDIHYWNQFMLLSAPESLQIGVLTQVVAALLTHHDALRLRVAKNSTGWQQYQVGLEQAIPFTCIDLSAIALHEQTDYITSIASEVQASLNLETGPLMRVIHFDLGMRPGRILFVIHHMAVDGISWRILLEDFQAVYMQLSRGEEVHLPAKTTSFQHWSGRLNEYAQSEEVKRELSYWIEQTPQDIAALPVDYHSQENTIASGRSIEVSLTVAETKALLQQVPSVYHTQINDVLLTALTRVITEVTGEDRLLLDLEGHGREDIFDDINLSRTVGWFTSMYPVVLRLEGDSDAGAALKSIKEQLRQIPQRGIGYGLLRYLCRSHEQVAPLAAQISPQISFNYLGQFDQTFTKNGLFAEATESAGVPVNPLTSRAHLLDIIGSVTGNQLRLSWMYSENIHRTATIEALARAFIQALRAIIAHCQQPDAGGYTPSDFPLAALSQQQIDRFFAQNQNVETVYPLSAMQQGLLFHSLYATQGGEYITQFKWVMRGDIEIHAWMQAWQEVVNRHGVLRTALLWQGVSQPQQVVYQQVTLPWKQLDWRAYETEEQQARLKTYLQEDRDRGFELTQAPLMHITFIRLAEQTYEFIWSHHHILLDGWSLPLVINEVLTSYRSRIQGRAVQLASVRPFQDYIAWLQKQDAVEAEAYWRQSLQGFTTPTSLSIDHPSTADPVYGQIDVSLAPDLIQALLQMTKQHHLTINTLFQGAWALVLSRYSEQDDVLFGATSSGRPPEIAGIESMIGIFINTLPARVHIDATQTVLSWLHSLQQQQMEMRQYEYSSLVDIQRWSEVRRGVALFESLLIFESYPVDDLQLEDNALAIQIEDSDPQVTYPLTLFVFKEQQFTLKMTYDIHRFEKVAIQRLLHHLQVVLEALTIQPQQRLAQISLLTSAENQFLRQWAQFPVTSEHIDTVTALFEQQAARVPTASAVQYEDVLLTYRDLNQRVNQLAHYLQTQGVQANVSVGLYIEPSLEMLVGMLSILKAGGICVPLDRSYPDRYVEWVLQSAQVRTIITQNSLPDGLSAYNESVVNLEHVADRIAAQSTENLACEIATQSVAFKLISAGSCISVTHQQLSSQLQQLQQLVPLTADDVVLQQSSDSLETALWEICWPLLYGGKVVIAPEDTRNNVAKLQYMITEQKITLVHLSPTLLTGLLDNLRLDMDTCVRTVLCSGGLLTEELATKCAVLTEIQSFYLYTTPETFAYLSIPLNAAKDSMSRSISLGMPLIPTCILDAMHQMVPVGLPGDLYVVMHGISTQNVDVPDTYVPNMLHPQTGTWLFKTGLRACYLDAEHVEILDIRGRNIWLSGHYVNMDLVQLAVLGAPGVEDCAVYLHVQAEGTSEMVAYVVPTGQFQVQRLQAHVDALLPSALVPRVYIPVSMLPLTSTGDVDVQELSHFSEATPEAAVQWETFVRTQSNLPEHAVKAIPQKYSEKIPVLHLADLLPDWKDEREEVRSEEIGAVALEEESLETGGQIRMAWSDGGPLSIPDDAPKTFTQALLATAVNYKDKGIYYVQPDGTEDFQAYETLLYEARCILTGLQQIGLRPGDKAILQIDTLREHFATFWACVLGGVIPVTVSVARTYSERDSVVNKLYNIWELLEHPPIIARGYLTEAIKGLSTILPMSPLSVLSVDKLARNMPSAEIYQSQPEDVVFYQLTSGSTGVPKCIQETHRGIIHHIHGAREFNGYEASNVSLNWLPVDHVVPILTCHLKDVYLGCTQVELKTDTVLTRPLMWLDCIEKYRVTHTWSPNFGYKLVSDWLAKGSERVWDLSSIQYFLNAGEQATLAVISDFLRMVEPFQVRPQTMQPSFGMAEACTCMTFQQNFDVKTGVHRIDKTSLGGRLKKARDDDARATTFVDLGGPVPGVQIRITDKDNQLVPEGVIGRFQIKGAVITPGYYKNAPANQEAFVGDDWFNSGDLGFILDGHLTLTGREKEIIVINGANHYCYEIEDVINNIPGVEPTFVGSCGIADARTGTEGLAIFFTPTMTDVDARFKLIQAIRTEVTINIGLNPLYIIPVEKKDFPKTTSGKIQRTQLKKSMQAGEFDEQLKLIDIHLENSNTIPDWFYRKTWIRREILHKVPLTSESGVTLLLLDELGLGEQISMMLQNYGQSVVCVEMGEIFSRFSVNHYRVNLTQEEQYRAFLEMLNKDDIALRRIIDLRAYGKYMGEPESLAQLETDQKTGLAHLLNLIQAYRRIYGDTRPVELYIVSSYTQAVSAADPIALEKLVLAGFIKTIEQEQTWIQCRQIDLPVDVVEANAALILQEVRAAHGDTLIAYRSGSRLVERLSKFQWRQADVQETPLVQGGFYLISGGLGGAGIEVARTLLQRYQAKLLLIGRRPLPPRNTWAKLLADETPEAALIAGYLELAQAGGEFAYVALDVCDQVAIEQTVQQIEANYGRSLDGVFHLAGTFTERVLQDESADSLAQAIRAKVTGAWVLHQLVKDRPGTLFVTFSSVNGSFGGAAAAAYSASNSFLDTFVHYQRNHYGLKSYCLAWSMWDEVGISRNYHMKELTLARGYYVIAARLALSSMLASLRRDQPFLLIGLDGSNQHIRHSVEQPTIHALETLTTYIAGKENLWYGQYNVPENYQMVAIAALPVTTTGEVDVQKLLAEHATGHNVPGDESVEAHSELEQQFVTIWREVFGIASVGIHDNFFSLGGDSIMSIQIIARANQIGIRLTTKQLLQHPTIVELAAVVNDTQVIKVEQGLISGDLPLTPIQHWFFDLDVKRPAHWNMPLLLAVQQTTAPEIIKTAFSYLLQHHDALRMRFRHNENGWQQLNADMVPALPFMVMHLGAIDEAAQARAIEIVTSELQGSLSFEAGLLIRMIYFDCGSDRQARLAIIVHHLVIDGVSWRILLEDLQNLIIQLTHQRSVQLPAKTVSFKHWSEQLSAYAQTDAPLHDLDYWLTYADVLSAELPRDYIGGYNTVASMNVLTLSLDVEETEALLYKVPETYHTQINDVLLAALAQTMTAWTGQSSLLVNLEGHGREEILEDVDISRTVGWFTSLYPLLLDLSEVHGLDNVIKSIKEQIRRVPHKGITYGILRYLTATVEAQDEQDKLERLRLLPQPEISFNYLGQFDQTLSADTLFSISSEASGFVRHPAGDRQHLLDVAGVISAGQLNISWMYSEQMHASETVEQLAGQYMQALRALILHCQNKTVDEYTPSDFPWAELEQSELDMIVKKLNVKRGN